MCKADPVSHRLGGIRLRTHLSALEKLARFTPVNTVMLRREIADAVIKVGKYPF